MLVMYKIAHTKSSLSDLMSVPYLCEVDQFDSHLQCGLTLKPNCLQCGKNERT